MPAPHHSVFYRPDALPAAQPTASKHWMYMLWRGCAIKIQVLHYMTLNGSLLGKPGWLLPQWVALITSSGREALRSIQQRFVGQMAFLLCNH